MRRGLRRGLVPREIVAVFGGIGIVLLARGRLAAHKPFPAKDAAQTFPRRLILGKAFRQNVPRPGEGGLGVGYVLVRGYETRRQRFGEATLLSGEQVRQRLKATLPRCGGPGPALGAVGKVDVFEQGQGGGGLHLGPQLGRQQVPLFKGGDDGLAAFVQFAARRQPVPDGRNRHLVEAAGGFLAVTGDEGDGGAFVEQADDGPGLRGPKAEFLGNEGGVVRHAESLVWGCGQRARKRNGAPVDGRLFCGKSKAAAVRP